MAAFMLHQAAEPSLLTRFKNTTGVYPGTYNIDQLLRYSALVNQGCQQYSARKQPLVNGNFSCCKKPASMPATKMNAVNNKDLQGLTEGIESLQLLLEESAISPATDHSL
jgi:hypothetical protein